MPRTLLKVFGGWWWVVVVVVESEFSVHLWSEASAYVWTKLNKKEKKIDFFGDGNFFFLDPSLLYESLCVCFVM